MVYTALLIALSLVLPGAFHAIGLGKAFSPMHLPALLAGFLLGPTSGAIVGITAPLLSSLFTGMPPLPVAIPMIGELGIYGLLSGLLYQRRRFGIYPSLILSLFGGRLAFGIVSALIVPLFGFPSRPLFGLFVKASLLEALPGIVLQLLIIPSAVILVEKSEASLWQQKDR